MDFKIRKLNNNNNGYWILISVLIFGAILGLVNYVMFDTGTSMESSESLAPEDNDKSLWDHITGFFSSIATAVFNFFTINIELLSNLGELGIIIRSIYTGCILIGITDIAWIG